MKRLLFFLLIATAFIAGCFSGNDSKPLIASSLPVWKSVAEYIGGRDFRYYSVLKGGESPHGYEPKPSDIKKLSKANLVIIHGLGLDNWAVKNVKEERVFNIGELLGKKYPAVKKPGYHLWMNPILMEEVYFEIANKLTEFYPKRRTYYLKRAEDYAEMIEQLIGRINECLKKAGTRTVVIYHPVWEPLLETFGISTIEIAKTPEEQVTPKRIKEVVEKAKAKGAKLVIGEPFSDRRVVKTIAEEIGGKVLILNPIPDKDYVVSLSEWGEKICSALKEK
jgi:zinc transport system substrate-binding protein